MSNSYSVASDSASRLAQITTLGFNPYSQWTRSLYCAEARDRVDEIPALNDVRLGGRLRSVRRNGGVIFAVLEDHSGEFQLFVSRRNMTSEGFELARLLRVGDVVGARGDLMRTTTSEPSLDVREIAMVSPMLAVMPDRIHGLQNSELAYRMRYLDLMTNPASRQVFINRSRIISALRQELDSQNFLEVETAILQRNAGGAMTRPFTTHSHALDADLQLRIATEFSLEQVLIGGIDRVYEIGRVFRNEGLSPRHSPEFTSLECYASFSNFQAMMELCQTLVYRAIDAIGGERTLPWGEGVIDFNDWRSVAMHDLVLEMTNQDLAGSALVEMFENECSERLVNPTVVYDWPIESSPLARRSDTNRDIAERFELYIGGREIANAFSELVDPVEQSLRFIDQGQNIEAHPYDMDFLHSLEYGLPCAGGLGIGVDRLVMLLTNQDSIRDVILFPVLRPPNETEAES